MKKILLSCIVALLATLSVYSEAVQEEAQVQKEYYERFLKILPARKIVLIFDAEARFSQEMMRTKPGKQGNRQNLLQSLKNDKK